MPHFFGSALKGVHGGFRRQREFTGQWAASMTETVPCTGPPVEQLASLPQ